MATAPNIIVFGESGSGKSSMINMIAGSQVAEISSGATGCTFQSKAYQISFMESTFNIYDTAGLDEGDAGKVPKEDAIVQLYKLLKNLSTGVNLLIFCMRGPRIKGSAPKNWRLFYEVMCSKNVPIVITITGLEQEVVMDEWWYRNKGAFQGYDMHPSGFACITATRGKKITSGGHKFDEEYEESKQKVRRIIKAHHLVIPWKAEPIEWFSHVVNITYESNWCWQTTEHRDVQRVVGPGITQLVERCEMSGEEAHMLGEMLTNA